MKIYNKKLSELKPYTNNPRKNEEAVDSVMRSIQQFGFRVPLVISKDGTIITGHTRYEASKRLGLEEVPCIVADDLSEEKANAFRLADNKTAEFAEWDFQKLEEEIAKCSDFDFEEYDFEQFGNIDDIFQVEEREPHKATEKEPKTIVCPFCGEVFEP